MGNRSVYTNNESYTYNIVWTRDFEDGVGNMRIALDSSNNIIACGVHKDEDKGIVIKYDSDGRILWFDQALPLLYKTMPALNDYNALFPSRLKDILLESYGYFFSIAVDSHDNIIAVGTFVENSNQSVIFIKKYAPDGRVIWEKSYSPSFFNLAVGVAVDSNDDIIVVGSGGTVAPPSMKGFVGKISGLKGTMLWKSWRIKGAAVLYTSVVLDTSNDAIVSGFTSSIDNSFDMILTKFGGVRGWRRREKIFSSQKAPFQIIQDIDGNFIVCGKAGDREDMQYLMKCTSNFSIVWEHQQENKGFLYDICDMKNGILAVTGHTYGTNEYYAALHSIVSGTRLNDMYLGERVSDRLDDYLRGIATNGNYDLFVTGARTVSRTMKVHIITAIQTPSKPVSTSPPIHHQPEKVSFFQKILRLLFGK